MPTEVEKESQVACDIANDLRLMAIALRKKSESPRKPTCEEIVRRALADREAGQNTGVGA